jgi:hypothetical protein
MAGRAAEKTRVSVAVDAWPVRLYLHNPNGTIVCPCSAHYGSRASNPIAPGGSADVYLDGGEGDDIGAVDSGYPLYRGDDPQLEDNKTRMDDPNGLSDVGAAVARMLLGNGRRCGICWGTGWVDGHRMWGGNRRIMCVVDTPGVEYSSGDVEVENDSPTPSMVGPGVVVWKVRINNSDKLLDAIRVRDQLVASPGGFVLEASCDGETWGDPIVVLKTGGPSAERPGPVDDFSPVPSGVGFYPGSKITTGTYYFRLTLQPAARVSHVELVSRSESMVNMQLPQLVQNASAELIAPFMVEEFELDPVVGFVERGSLIDLEPRGGMVGSVWVVTDVTIKKTSQGQIFGVTGTARSAQPLDVVACVSMSDALDTGLLDRGRATRGLEASGGGAPEGIEPNVVDASVQAARRGASPRLGAGNENPRSVIILNTGEY